MKDENRGEWSFGDPPNHAWKWANGLIGSGYYGPPKPKKPAEPEKK